jgi:quercetin dioxygenase-like cupin family protein
MTGPYRLGGWLLLQLAVAPVAEAQAAPAPEPAPATREIVTRLSRDLLPNAPGKEMVALEVLFAPGASSVPHRHPATAFVYAYVIAGEIESALGEEPPRLYRAGESWHEDPGALHRVTRNTSSKRPARLLAIFIGPAGETDFVLPAGQGH